MDLCESLGGKTNETTGICILPADEWRTCIEEHPPDTLDGKRKFSLELPNQPFLTFFGELAGMGSEYASYRITDIKPRDIYVKINK